jgi:hypothetical protein
MFLPYETTLSLWFSATPIYRWEPAPVVEASDSAMPMGMPAGTSDADSVVGACKPSSLPAMRLVLRGVKWSAYPVFGMRENLAWDQVSQTRREEDERRNAENLHHGLKEAPPKSVPVANSHETPGGDTDR